MAINITFGDYDTVCYSNQHNIIELIKHSVGLSIEVNINANNINNLNTRVDDVEQKAQEGHDAFLLAEALNRTVSGMKLYVDSMWEYNMYAESSGIGRQIEDLKARVRALEGGG